MSRNRRFQRVFTPFAILSLLTFLSCGHQETAKDEGLFSDLQQSASSEDGDRANEDHTASNSEPSAATSAELEASLDEPTATPPVADNGPSAPTKFEETPVATNSEVPANDGPALMAAEPSILPETAPEAVIPAEAAVKPEVAVEGKKSSKLPLAPKETIWKKGHTLNRFYFLRSGDTPMSVSEIIYGDTSHGNDLTAWNSGTWTAGKTIFYVSPEKADDTEMLSFYEERGITTEAYEVQKGDYLSKIAAEKFGNPGSWKEIAVLNSLETPDSLEVGKSITLYPASFPTRPVAKVPEKVAQVEKPVMDEEMPVAAEMKQVVPEAPAPKMSPGRFAKIERPEAETANPDMSSFLEQHFGTILISLGLILMGYLFLRRMTGPSDHLE